MAILGKVSRIFLAIAKGQPMREVSHVFAIAGIGLEGDCYATGKGLYSDSQPLKIRHITLIAEAAIREAAETGVVFDPAETRRNVVIEGISSIDINALVGKRLRLGTTGPLIEVLELCTPCDWPDRCAQKTGFKMAFEGRGGLRAKIIESGRIIRFGKMIG